MRERSRAVSGNGDTNCTAGEEHGNDGDWLESAVCEWSQEHDDCVCVVNTITAHSLRVSLLIQVKRAR